MARNVRNFWIELEIDGRVTKVATGPRRKDGGFLLKVHMRDKGEICRDLVKITGRMERVGKVDCLVLSTVAHDTFFDTPVYTWVTQR